MIEDKFLAQISNLDLERNKKQVVITSTPLIAEKSYEGLVSLHPDLNILHLPNSETLPYDFFSPPPKIRSKRIQTFHELSKNTSYILISSVQTLLSPCPHISHVTGLGDFKVGDMIDRELITSSFQKSGYVRKEIVEEHGEYALRGSVIDVYLSSKNHPVRIEIFDDQIESIRFFNESTQLTNDRVEKVMSLPAYEYPMNKLSFEKFTLNWRRSIEGYEGDSDIFKRIQENKSAEGAEMYLPLFYEKKSSILSFLENIDSVYIQKDSSKKAEEYTQIINDRYEEYRYDLNRPLLHPGDLFLEYDQLDKYLNLSSSKVFSLESNNTKSSSENSLVKDAEVTNPSIQNFYNLPEPNELVVHLSHGIGIYKGLKTLDSPAGKSDCLEIEYSDNSKVFVPVEYMNLISKYFGPEGKKLDSLGSKKWNVRKEKALKQAFDTAAELLEVQSKRGIESGFAYSINQQEFKEFTDQFPYEETFDQQRTIDEVASDLSSNKSMDRLVCGEVGFGKTEVAIRASYIVSSNSKQTCILVPTTLLAEQHYQSFKERFSNEAFNIEILSRNVSKKERERILKDLKEGKIDILIGTHAVIQESVIFKDLGLLIIDEEHRFGVRQKEKIKRLKVNIEILSLSATPIPRSLNLSLSELKDFSIIATPPNDRLPVRTFTYSYNENFIKEAIQRELIRNGQIYYLCNDLSLIQDRKSRLQKLFPELQIEIVHGKLKPKDIESTMLGFNRNTVDILVCSTIIESGIDVANANTLIVEDADKLGLAQLHQLRGRIGRGEKQAYAYFLKSKNIQNRKAAESRIEALIGSSSLSAGLLLAIKDLEIRGAGEILGSNQSGVFESIGLEMYTRLLRKATDYIRKGELNFEHFDENPEINLGQNSLIPESYLPDLNQRLVIYNRIASCQDNNELKELQIEMINRFGLFPKELKVLFIQTELKILAENNNVSKINIKKNKIDIFFKELKLPVTLLDESDLKDSVELIKNVIEAAKKNTNAKESS